MEEKTTQAFDLAERKSYFAKKWRREHWAVYAVLLAAYVLCVFLAVRSGVRWLAYGTLGALISLVWLENCCAAYVERHAFDGKGDN